MATIDELIDRISQAPTIHLGARSISALYAYIAGYQSALRTAGLPPLVGETVPSAAPGPPEPFSRMSIATYCVLQSEDEHEALAYFLAWRNECAEMRSPTTEPTHNLARPQHTGLLELLELLLQRPAMYLGTVRVENLWAFVSGYEWAERDLEIHSTGVQRLRGFSEWVAARYRTDRPWFAVFRALEVGTALSDVEHFKLHLAMYLKGASPDAAYEHSEKILEVSLREAIRVSLKPVEEEDKS